MTRRLPSSASPFGFAGSFAAFFGFFVDAGSTAPLGADAGAPPLAANHFLRCVQVLGDFLLFRHPGHVQ